MDEETVGSAEIVANLAIARLGLGSRVAESMWVVLDDEHWLVEGYGVLDHDGRLMLYLGSVGGGERTYEMAAGERLPRYRRTTERGTP